MEIFVVGLIVYVVLSVIGEMAKKNKNAPPPQTGGGKVIPFPSDSNARRKTFQDVLREALDEASLEGKEAKDDAEGEYRSGDRYQGEGSSGAFGEGADADEASIWPSQRDGSLTGEEIMERMEDTPFSEDLSSEGLSSEGLSFEGLSSEGFSSEGLSSEGLNSLEGAPVTEDSLGGDSRWGSLGPISEDVFSFGSRPKSSTGSDELSRWEHEDATDFADDYADTTDSGFSYGEIGFSDSGSDASPIYVSRGLLTGDDDLLRGIIVSEIMNTPGGKSRQMRGVRGPNRFVRK